MASNYYRSGGFGGFTFFPPVIKNIIIINVVIFFLQNFFGSMKVDGVYVANVIYEYFALMPLGSGYFQIWQLVSYQFLHGGFAHIFMNLLTLWMLGVEIENYWGSKKFLIFYLLSGVGGGLAQLLIAPFFDSVGPTVGASGAIFGVMVAFGLLFPDRYIYFNFLLPIKAKYYILGMVLLNIFSLSGSGGGIAYLAHIGGGLAGFIFLMLDKNVDISFKSIFGSKSKGSSYWNQDSSSTTRESFFRPKPHEDEPKVQDANFYDLKEGDVITQEEIDRILDKISQFGYTGLTEREKKILFEASKRMK